MGSARTEAQLTPIWISKRTGTVLYAAGVVALVLLVWCSPSIPIMLLGGFALALVVSFPIWALSRLMPRGWAVLVSFLALLGIAILAIVFLLPVLIVRLGSIISNVVGYGSDADLLLRSLLEPHVECGLLSGTPEEFVANLGQDLQNIAQQILGGLLGFISGTFNLVLTLFGVLFVAVYFLVNIRNTKVAYLLVSPTRYRRDARDLWEAFAFSLYPSICRVWISWPLSRCALGC